MGRVACIKPSDTCYPIPIPNPADGQEQEAEELGLNPNVSGPDTNRLRQLISYHTATAIHGFFRSISLSKGNSLQDTLRLLTLWFKYGSADQVAAAMSEGAFCRHHIEQMHPFKHQRLWVSHWLEYYHCTFISR